MESKGHDRDLRIAGEKRHFGEKFLLCLGGVICCLAGVVAMIEGIPLFFFLFTTFTTWWQSALIIIFLELYLVGVGGLLILGECCHKKLDEWREAERGERVDELFS
ncbi:TPA: hypothetical protein DF272_00585 [Candidatus Falkowbacteria bacterium]|nr:hypothetical protein [Candidatus Falkowbacteria bacterium]